MPADSEHQQSESRLTYLGHSCLLVEVVHANGGSTRILLDPGNLSPDVTEIGRVDAVLVTHAHPDHIDPAQIERIVQQQGSVTVYGPSAALDSLSGDGVIGIVAEPGPFEVGGLPVNVMTTTHETIYPGVPLPENLSYDIAGIVFAPGDSLTTPPAPVNVLLAPLGGPWMKLSEGIDYVRRVKPKRLVPVHDGGLAAAHRNLHRMLISKFAPEGTEVCVMEQEETLLLSGPAAALPTP